MTPLVSFVVTYYNEPEALLRACLESILSLHCSHDEVELLLVDDESEQDVQMFLSSFFSSVRYVRQEHAGLSVARNTGIAQSRGKYIQFVDADDCLIPSAYETVLSHLRGGTDDVVMFGMTKRQDEDRDADMSVERFSSTDFLQHHNLRAAVWSYAFRREILDELRFFPGIYHEDELFTPCLFLRAKTILSVAQPAYFYRQREGTITSSKSSAVVRKRLDDIFFILKSLREMQEPMLTRKVRQLTVDYLQNVWMLTRNWQVLRERSNQLRDESFLPLPLKTYSLRYFCVAVVLRILGILRVL